MKLKKSLGQNLLIDKNIIEKITSLEKLNNQTVLEIGPGSGNLTNKIFEENPKKMFLIEKDQRFYKIINEKFKFKENFEIVDDDILKFNLDNFAFKNVIVFGNLPYNISTQILAKFISVKKWPPFYKKIIFMFQKEVAERIVAKSNTTNFSRISILTNYRLDIIQNFNVSKNCFFPRPNVESKIIVFTPKLNYNYKIKSIKNLEKITNMFFSNRRKMVNKVFAKIFKNHKYVAKKLNIKLESRPQELSCNDYFKITEFFEKLN